jgi:hypothetical protein
MENPAASPDRKSSMVVPAEVEMLMEMSVTALKHHDLPGPRFNIGGEDPESHDDLGSLLDQEDRENYLDFEDREAYFKHSQPFLPGDVLRFTVDECLEFSSSGFAGAELDPSKFFSEEISSAAAWVHLGDGTTSVLGGISLDGRDYSHDDHIFAHLPEAAPYDVALRVETGSNVPQIQFNEDGAWHDFAPLDKAFPECRTALKAGPWFPFLSLSMGECVSDFRIDHPKPTKSAGKKMSALPATSVAPVHPAVEVGAGSADARAIIASDPAAGGCTSTQSAGMKRKPAAAAAATGDDFEELPSKKA